MEKRKKGRIFEWIPNRKVKVKLKITHSMNVNNVVVGSMASEQEGRSTPRVVVRQEEIEKFRAC